MTETEKSKGKEGLGGWLILIGFGVVITPFKIWFTLFPVYKEIFGTEAWEILTTPGTEIYHPFWSTLLIGEITVNLLVIIVSIYLIFLFFTKKRLFPKLFIGITVFSLFFILIDTALVKIVLPEEPMFDPDTVKEFAGSVIVCLIWVPYMLVSKRVKATFVR